MNKENCTITKDGKVLSLKSKGIDHPSVVTIEYEVNNVKYQVEETVKLESKVIKFGFIPIGQKLMPKIDTTIGAIVQVRYNPDKPSEAYIVGNDGKINCS